MSMKYKVMSQRARKAWTLANFFADKMEYDDAWEIHSNSLEVVAICENKVDADRVARALNVLNTLEEVLDND